ncbi:Isopentenyl-diphosphate Delta-isomerase [Streptomyces sp. RB5]|uniref:Isopentenyl-diphosphate Delta-isomerase n=1 Tax=Streptomyces smaragdinus TaxID=2585196 RepID=A0A7K0CQ97_9ACTN|nr:NUDIX domain-containing protein [Streptomyces smaragdinus]MQY15571.1 Isopentenyl-diphosphate Delta-isomerase [Streptomyces smaragdinus]
MAEPVDQVDEHDRVIGVVDRAEAQRANLLHRIAVTVCRDPDDRVLVHRRPDDDSRHPGHYDSVAGGAANVGEGYGEAAARELREEFGIRLPAPPPLVFKRIIHGRYGRYWLGVHEARLDAATIAAITANPREIAWWGWMTVPELREAAARLPFVGGEDSALWTYLALTA